MRVEKIVVRSGLVLLGLGLVLLLFVAYQLWGTAYYEARAQSHLKSELARELHHRLPTTSTGLDGSAQSEQLGLPPIAHITAPRMAEPALSQPVGLLSIPKIGILDAIVQGVGEAQLEQGPGHYPGTALPGEQGNVAIAGHRTTYAHPFYNLDSLVPGDGVYILTVQGLFRYTVTGSTVVAPTDVTVLESAQQSSLTLTTCNPRYSAATRLVVTAKFDGHSLDQASTTPVRPKATQLATENSASGLGSGGESVAPAIAWGIVAIAIVFAAVVCWRRMTRRSLRIMVAVLATPAFVITLFVCFEHVSLALPSSF
jgi:sortase A